MAGGAWEREPDEDADSYARFLVYRNCGPTRSLRKAYHRYLQAYDGYTGGTDRLHVPGTWHRDCVAHQWVNRAAAWDVANLVSHGARLVALHAGTVLQIAKKNARAARRLAPGDDGWDDLCKSVKLVQEWLTPEVVRGIQERGRGAGRRAVPAGDGSRDPDE